MAFQIASLCAPLAVLVAAAIDLARLACVARRRTGGAAENRPSHDHAEDRDEGRVQDGQIARTVSAPEPRPVIAPAVAVAAAGVSLLAACVSLLLFSDPMQVPQDRVRVGSWLWLAFADFGWAVRWDGGVDVATLLLELAAAVWFALTVFVIRGVHAEWRHPLLGEQRRRTEEFVVRWVAGAATAWLALQLAAANDDLALTLVILQAVSWVAARMPTMICDWSHAVLPTADTRPCGARDDPAAPTGWPDRRLLAWWLLGDLPAALALVMLSANAIDFAAGTLAGQVWGDLLRSEPAVADTVAFAFAMTVLGRCGLLPWVGVLPRLGRLDLAMRCGIQRMRRVLEARLRWRERLLATAAGTSAPAAGESPSPAFAHGAARVRERTLALPALAVQAVYAVQAIAAMVLLWRLVPLWQTAPAGPATVGTLAALGSVWLGLTAVVSDRPARVALAIGGVHAALLVASTMADPFTPAPWAAVLLGLLGAGFATAAAWETGVPSLEDSGIDSGWLPASVDETRQFWAAAGRCGTPRIKILPSFPAALLTLGLTGGPVLIAGFLPEGDGGVIGRLLLIAWLVSVFATWRMSCRRAWSPGRVAGATGPAFGGCCVMVAAAVLAVAGRSGLWADRWPTSIALTEDTRMGLVAGTNSVGDAQGVGHLARIGLVMSLSCAVAVVAWMRFRQPWSLPPNWRRRLGAGLRLLENELYVEPSLDWVARWFPRAVALLSSVAPRCVVKVQRWLSDRCARPLLEALDATRSDDHESLLIPMAVLVAVGLILAALWGSGS